jgi:hypothetical protein
MEKDERKAEVMGRRERKRKQLLDCIKEKRRNWKLEEETLVCTLWKTRFVTCYGTGARQSHHGNDDDFIWILQTLTFHTEGRQRRR